MSPEDVAKSLRCIKNIHRDLGLPVGPPEPGEDTAWQRADLGVVNAGQTDLASISRVLQRMKPIPGVQHPVYRPHGARRRRGSSSSPAPPSPKRANLDASCM